MASTVKLDTTTPPDPLEQLAIENESLKMTIEDLERHIASRDAKLAEARMHISNWKQCRARLKVLDGVCYELHGILDDAGFGQEDYE